MDTRSTRAMGGALATAAWLETKTGARGMNEFTPLQQTRIRLIVNEMLIDLERERARQKIKRSRHWYTRFIDWLVRS